MPDSGRNQHLFSPLRPKRAPMHLQFQLALQYHQRLIRRMRIVLPDLPGRIREDPAASPSRRRAQTWRSLFIAPCTPQLNPRACQSCSIAALPPFIAATATYPTAPDISIIYQKAQKGMRHSADIPPWTDTSAVRQPKIMSIRSWRHTFRTSDTCRCAPA